MSINGLFSNADSIHKESQESRKGKEREKKRKRMLEKEVFLPIIKATLNNTGERYNGGNETVLSGMVSLPP